MRPAGVAPLSESTAEPPIAPTDAPAAADDAGKLAASVPPKRPSRVRSLVPFVVALGLLALLAYRVDRRAAAAAIAELALGPFVAFTVLWCVAVLAADALANRVAYRHTLPGVRWHAYFLFRGASYLAGVVNHHLGQAYLTVLMAREGRVPIVRIAGATLVSYVTWMGCLVGSVAVALLFTDLPKAAVFGLLGAGVGYLVVLGLRPRFLMRWALLAPLFEAGPTGHLLAMLARMPHLAVLVLGNWVAFGFFDVAIPATVALVYLPILLVATTLPIAPQGFGTRDTVAALFFAQYAVGATQPERLGRLAACTLVWGVAQTMVAIVIGVVCARLVTIRINGSPLPSTSTPTS